MDDLGEQSILGVGSETSLILKILFYFVVILLISLVFASLGISIGFRTLYVSLLLKIFDFGKQRIDNELNIKRNKDQIDDDSDYEDVAANTEQHDSTSRNIFLERSNSIADYDTSFDSLRDYERREFHLQDVCDFVKMGVMAIVDDEVTKRFDTEELPSWNLLTRTNKKYTHLSLRLTIMWGIGFLIRYSLLLPARILVTFIGVSSLVLCTAIIGCLPDGSFKRWVYWHACCVCFRMLVRAFSGIITFHDRHNIAQPGGITVANHTSPIDVSILASDTCYALVGQRQGGFLGVLQGALQRASNHIWFDRFEMTDRQLVMKRMKEHLNNPNNLPILIFPEGTCINNSAVMMFKKGSFEISNIVYPVAIKFDPRFGDPFWNSSKHGYMYYLMLMLSSWAIVCDVWYLPPMTKKENENSIEFANRVKSEIAKKGGLIDLQWDGQLKRLNVKDTYKIKKQQEFSQRIKVT